MRNKQVEISTQEGKDRLSDVDTVAYREDIVIIRHEDESRSIFDKIGVRRIDLGSEVTFQYSK